MGYILNLKIWTFSTYRCHTVSWRLMTWQFFPHYWPFVWGNPPVTGGFISQRPVMRSFGIFYVTSCRKKTVEFPVIWDTITLIWRHSPHKGKWRGVLMFSLTCARINDWVNNGEAGDLRRHRTHYDVIVMVETNLWLAPDGYECFLEGRYNWKLAANLKKLEL